MLQQDMNTMGKTRQRKHRRPCKPDQLYLAFLGVLAASLVVLDNTWKQTFVLDDGDSSMRRFKYKLEKYSEKTNETSLPQFNYSSFSQLSKEMKKGHFDDDQKGEPDSLSAKDKSYLSSITTPFSMFSSAMSGSWTGMSHTATGAEKINLPETRAEGGFPAICQAPPNYGNPDSDTLRHHVLVRIQHLIATLSNLSNQTITDEVVHPNLLCIFPFFSHDREQAALETYGRECDGVLIVRNKNDPVSNNLAKNIAIPIFTLEVDQRKAYWKEDLIQYLSSQQLKAFDWIHWASPNRYTLVQVVRSAIREQIKDGQISGPAVFQTWFGERFLDSKYYLDLDQFFTADCSEAWVWNAEASKQILRTCAAKNLTVDIQCQKPSDVTCLKVSTAEQWTRLKKFFQILSPAGEQQWYRIHAILNGSCDRLWNRFLGALDENGNAGYIHDPTFLSRNPPALNLQPLDMNGTDGVCDIRLGQGDEGFYGSHALRKIRADLPVSFQSKKVLCMVYTHEGAHEHLRAIAETWGPKCDGFFAASNKTDKSIGAVNLLHEGPEEYANMWMKVVAMFKYAYQHYMNEYDFFHIGGDDMYVIVENLRYTVSTGNWKSPWNLSEPLMLGGPMAISKKMRFCGGGGGYTLNREALKKFVAAMTNDPECRRHYKSPMEDKMMAKCLFSATEIQCADTNDEKMEQRYHPYTVDMHARWTKQGPLLNWKFLIGPIHNITEKERLGQISERSVTFHLKPEGRAKTMQVYEDKGMRRFHAIIYGLCPENSTLARYPS